MKRKSIPWREVAHKLAKILNMSYRMFLQAKERLDNSFLRSGFFMIAARQEARTGQEPLNSKRALSSH